MSLTCEPTELTPLRRNNCSRRQQQQHQNQEQQDHHSTSEQIDHIDDYDEEGQLYLGGNCSSSEQHGISATAANTTIPASASASALALGHLQSPAFSEYMSINNNNHHPTTVGSDSSRADTSEPNSQQALNPKAYIMSDTKRIITRVTIDFVVLLAGESLFISAFISLYFVSNFVRRFLPACLLGR